MEELCIELNGERIKIYSFMDKKISLKNILKHAHFCKDSKNVKFKITLIDKISKKDKIINLRKALNLSDILIVNSASKINIRHFNIKTISYGLDEKSTVNVSSIDEIENDKPIVCIQRSFSSVFLKEYDPMEIKVKRIKNIDDIATFLGIITLKLVLELD
ncbi:hypothetical protein [Anaerofustis butyriciformans]|uniref:hypothetical protein n=1 Tax=Anaerofustis butyriciformans TaxID=3108533 RepID=UPI002E354A95|nr:hypothetical protein [Anaerofustis sp. HA2171]